MASHSPVGLDPTDETNPAGPQATYLQGWQGITRLMDGGASWSGRERNCAFLNLGDRRFVNISAAAGLDHDQDGRAVAEFDWDADGDLDLWLKSRNGRQLLLLENTRPRDEDFISLRLVGKTCNRDAIGARVEVSAAGRRYVKELRCGEGYLAQSSGELLFNLNGADTPESVVVHWPGGEAESFVGITPGRRQRLVQGTGRSQVLAPRSAELPTASAGDLPSLPASARVVLRTPLPLPSTMQREYFDLGQQRARLINLWSSSCPPCVQELGEFARRSDELAYVGLDVLALCLDAAQEAQGDGSLFEERIAPQMVQEAPFSSRDLTEEELVFFEVLLAHLIAKPGAIPAPASLLVNKHGLVEILYLGAVDVDTLIEDGASFGMQPQTVGVRSSYPGRWFYGMPRNLEELGRAFRERGRLSDASFYSALHQMGRRRAQ